jgi:hypothetical protein
VKNLSFSRGNLRSSLDTGNSAESSNDRSNSDNWAKNDKFLLRIVFDDKATRMERKSQMRTRTRTMMRKKRRRRKSDHEK